MKYFIILLTLFLVVIFVPHIYAVITFEKVYGGNDCDFGTFVQQLCNGGYIVTGVTYSYGEGSSDVWLLKTDSLGDTIWTKTYGGQNSDVAKCVQLTLDKCYIIVGYTESYGAGEYDVWLIKTDSLGNIIWSNTYGGHSSDVGNFVQTTSDSGYILTGYTESYGVGGKDLYLIKTNSNGDVTWVKTYGNTLSDEGRAVQQTNDGGYVVTGLTDSLNQNHYSLWLIKTDSFGNAEWKKTYDDNGWGNNTWGNSVQQTTDGGYIVTGFYQGLVKQRDRLAYDLWIVRTDSVGNLLWTSGYGDRATVDEGKFVQLSSDGGYIITGFTTSFQSSSGDVVLIKLNSLGGISWVETYDGENYFDAGNCAQPTSDGGYIITGTIASGYSSIYVDLWLIKTDSLGSTGIEEAIVPSSLANWQIEIYPNPFITSTTIILSLLSIERSVKDIELKIYDACGRLVKDFSLGTWHSALGTVVTWDGRDDRGRDVTSGIYFLKLKVKSEKLSVEEVRKVIKIE